jgi:hypothetical protein
MIAQGTERTELEAHHAAIRSSSHSSMKAENWFQLRIVGVTQKARSSDRAFFVVSVASNPPPPVIVPARPIASLGPCRRIRAGLRPSGSRLRAVTEDPRIYPA